MVCLAHRASSRRSHSRPIESIFFCDEMAVRHRRSADEHMVIVVEVWMSDWGRVMLK